MIADMNELPVNNKRKKKQPRWPDYEVVKMPHIVTFGTTLFIRKDKRALRIVFPAGQSVTFMPEKEITELKRIA